MDDEHDGIYDKWGQRNYYEWKGQYVQRITGQENNHIFKAINRLRDSSVDRTTYETKELVEELGEWMAEKGIRICVVGGDELVELSVYEIKRYDAVINVSRNEGENLLMWESRDFDEEYNPNLMMAAL